MADNWLVKFSTRVLRDARIIFGRRPLLHSALSATSYGLP